MKKLFLILSLAVLVGACGKGNDANTSTGYNGCPAVQMANPYSPTTCIAYNAANYNPNLNVTTGAYNNGAYNPYAATSCPVAGQVYTQYGCLAQSTCPTGYGMYGTQCVPGTTGYNYNNTTGCAAGQVPTQMGCLYQGTCPAGYGYLQNYNACVPAVQNYNTGVYGYPYNNYPYTNGIGGGFHVCVGFGC